MRRWICLALLLGACDGTGSVELDWTVTHNGQPSSCADVSADHIDIVYLNADKLDDTIGCEAGTFTTDFDSGEAQIRLSLRPAGTDTELAIENVTANVDAGDTTVVDVTFDVVP